MNSQTSSVIDNASEVALLIVHVATAVGYAVLVTAGVVVALRGFRR